MVNIPVSIGELFDKISILKIKHQHYPENSNVKKELQHLTNIANTIDQNDIIQELSQLHAVNESLWNIEDQLRQYEKERNFGDDFVQLARSVYQYNDERSTIKRRINEKSNSSIVEEKFY